MSTFNTPRTTPTRVSSRKTTPSPVSVPAPNLPLPRLVSPRRTRTRHMRNDPTNCGLYPVTETDEDDAPSRCPSLFYAPTSPGSETHRSSLVYTPCNDDHDQDPFEDYTFSPVSDTFFDDPATKAPRALRSPIRTPITPMSRVPRVPNCAPYQQRVLLPALPILAPCQQRPAPPSPPTPGTPITPTTPGIMSANLVSALRDLLTTCSEYKLDGGMFADADDIVPGQFDDAVSPKPSSPTLLAQPTLAFCPLPTVPPRTPPPKHATCIEELLLAPRQTRGPREPLAPGLEGDHSVLAGMAAAARADRPAAEAAAYEDLAPSFPSLTSMSTASSASSLSSLCGMTSGMTMIPRPPVTPPQRKPTVSSRRLLRSPLPVWS